MGGVSCFCVTQVLLCFLQGMFIWVSKDSPQELIQNVLGVPHFGGIVEDMVCSTYLFLACCCKALGLYMYVVESVVVVHLSHCSWAVGLAYAPCRYVQLCVTACVHFLSCVQTALPSLDNGVSNVVNMLISQIKKSRQHFMPLLVIR